MWYQSVLSVISLIFVIIYLRVNYFPSIKKACRSKFRTPKDETVVAFMHPYSEGCAGGERVLWWIIKALQQLRDDVHVVLFSGKPLNENGTFQNITEEQYEKILTDKVKKIFNIELDRPVQVVFLYNRDLLEAASKARLTLIGQSLASIMLGWEAVSTYTPDVFIDTHGLPFTYFVAKLAGCKVGSYTHYPTISTDMLERVVKRVTAYNNDDSVTNSTLKTSLKLTYYKIFSALYGFFAGYFCDMVMVNSTWTHGHVKSLWWLRNRKIKKSRLNIEIVYPPCNVDHLTTVPLAHETRKPYILSVGQFRPEKDHALQVRAFSSFLKNEEYDLGGSTRISKKDVKLILLGGCRNEEDSARVDYLKKLAQDMEIPSSQFEIITNAPFSQLLEKLGESMIGIHSMWNEHFGICVVEYMAAGLITLSHNSGGPKSDIVTPNKTGFLAETEKEYSQAINDILSRYHTEEMKEIQENARKSADRYTEEKFVVDAQECLKELLI
ncbi:glycosyl transferase [Naegleria gruberi]|uniref:GDP-Man:Man(3)GlcNAc(2)-PP-Dol alpha-1,2-mannosyltransferase n=1 Tax=Naegleria gruberi TaxID=5762 RepID=D2V5R3_NAEGR|nr:glycosyl transferase [Naegleria gruberi]EFC47843.1 glycosyl transferase [Naegleria gruberi]|eukprot:XP_002680587.1 glycosyl transferase [Naegleria gruberi strain NEG-M]